MGDVLCFEKAYMFYEQSFYDTRKERQAVNYVGNMAFNECTVEDDTLHRQRA